MMNSDFLNQTYFSLTIIDWLILAGIWWGTFFVFALAKRILASRFGRFSKRTKNKVDDYIFIVIKNTKLFFLVAVGLYTAIQFVDSSDIVDLVVEKLTIALFLVQLMIWVNKLIAYYVERYKEEKMEEDAGAVTTIQALGFVGRLVLYSIIILVALDNFGVEVTTLVASLGIGGIAVALAVQNILGDLFASLSILLDQPFVVGDFLVIDEYMGSVEKTGLKTTRMRSLSGEQIIVSNNDLLSSRIRNYKRMYERRVQFTIGVTYQTTEKQLEIIPGILREIIEKQDQIRFDRAHFKEFGDFAMIFEIVYYVTVPDYNVYMDIQQAINLQIYYRFEQEGIVFAYPTQTLYVEPVKTEMLRS